MNSARQTRVALALACALLPDAACHAGEPLDEAVAKVRPANSTDRCGGENCAAVARGLIAFLDRRLHGLQANGRSCADCHMPSDSLQLSPASAEARFQFLQWRRTWNPRAADPLFLPIDADDFRVNGAAASDFSNLRENGLIRVTHAAARQCPPDRSGDQCGVDRDQRRCVASGTECFQCETHRARRRHSLAARSQSHRRISTRWTQGEPAGAGARRIHGARADR